MDLTVRLHKISKIRLKCKNRDVSNAKINIKLIRKIHYERISNVVPHIISICAIYENNFTLKFLYKTRGALKCSHSQFLIPIQLFKHDSSLRINYSLISVLYDSKMNSIDSG